MTESSPTENPVSGKSVSGEFVIRNKFGIHARPAALFVKAASKYKSDVTVEKQSSKVSGKSIMGLMTLEAAFGTKIRIVCEGEDAENVLQELGQLIDQKFFED